MPIKRGAAWGVYGSSRWVGLEVAIVMGVVAGLVWGVVELRQGVRVRTVMAAGAVDPVRALHQPDQVCARCHAAIVGSYEGTAMARGSGTALGALIPGEFRHASSGVNYRIFRRDGRAWMSFDRPAAVAPGGLHGERELEYFVGSGTHGRTYLYQVDGLWFQLPVNYYRRSDGWEMAPSFAASTTMPAPLPVDANCMHCHASEIEATLPEARNRFVARPFDEGGIGCRACHGDPARHLATEGRGPITNPDKLPVAARDSACIQCHLEGNAVVYRPGRSLAQFQPGDTLSEVAVYFVRASQADGGRRASSQYEALLLSACKRGSGDRLTCTTCHDPHSEPAPEQRVAYFRARCLACHSSPAMAVDHHPEQPDCASCHMPSRATVDISHEQVTDHNIERRPKKENRSPGGEDDLVPVGGVRVSDRELGLAYAQLAQRGDRRAGEKALSLLTRAAQAGAADEQVHVNLGFLYQMSNNLPAAAGEYAATLGTDRFNPAALTNLAVLDAGRGELGEAVRLLERLVAADPSQTQAGLDLAYIECQMGRTSESRALALRLQQINPDAEQLRLFLDRGTLGGQSCRPATGPAAR